MSAIKMVSWNVNGLRAIAKKGFSEWLDQYKPDILALQETKIDAQQLTADLREQKHYKSFFSHANRKGYSGVALYSRIEPKEVTEGMGIERFDQEGRVLKADYGDFLLFNIYFPNGKANEIRLQYKLDFYAAFHREVSELLAQDKKIVVCGDFNTAHKAIDLARPKENETISGFLPIERDWLDKYIDAGFLDTFRWVNTQPHHYTWWHQMTNARARNVGWRIDYFYATATLEKHFENATIEPHVMGSDHCPVTLSLSL
jgi:exodeoxyribonuclease III